MPDAFPRVVIPAGDVMPKFAPLDNVNVPPPLTTVPAAIICKVAPLFTVKLIVFVTEPPEVKYWIPALLKIKIPYP